MTIVTSRPTSTYLDASTTKVPNVTAHTNIDDSPDNDATYVQGITHGSGLRMTMTDVSVASNQRVRQARIRVRVAHDAVDVGWREDMHLRFRDNTIGKNTPTRLVGTTNNSFAVLTGPWETVGPNNQTWTDALADRIDFDIAWPAVNPVGSFLKLSELYADFEINDQPTVGSVSVTNTTTTTRPTVSWPSAAQADGYGLLYWRVKIFQNALVSVPGFSPDTSTPTWDSGQQNGDPKTAQVGTALVNGVTYVAYVWVGMSWPGPQGAIWWSAAQASSSFTISLSPPGIPNLLATVESTPPSFRVRLEVEDTGNMLTDNDAQFETTAGTWAGRTNSTAVRTTAQFQQGAAALQQTATAGADAIAGTATGTSGYPCLPGVTYSAGFRTRTAVTARSIRAQIEWFTAAGASISVSEGASDTDATNWTTLGPFVTAVAPTTARFMAVRWRVISAAASEVHYLDSAWLRRGTLPAGSYAASGQLSTLELQRYEPIPSRMPGLIQNWAPQDVYAPGSETGTTDAFSLSDVLDTVSIDKIDRAWPDPDGAGETVAHWKVRSSTASLLYLSSNVTNATDLSSPRFRLPVVPSVVHTASAYVWSSSGTFSGQIIIRWITDADVLVSFSFGGTVTVGSTPQLLSVSATPPATASGAIILIQNVATSTFDEVYVAAVNWSMASARPSRAGVGRLAPVEYTPLREVSRVVTFIGDKEIFYDHEAAGGRPLYYRARSTVTISGQPISSAWSALQVVYMPTPRFTLLKDPLRPWRALTLTREPEAKYSQSETGVTFTPIAGPDGVAYPFKIRDTISGWDGDLTLNYQDNTELRALRDILTAQSPLLVQWFDGGQTFIIPTGRDDNRRRSGWGQLVIPYVETERP